MVKRLTEKVLRKMLLEALEQRDWMAWPAPVGLARMSGRVVRFGQPGMADVLACVLGRLVAIETKVGREPLRPEQLMWLTRLANHGGLAIVARATRRSRVCYEMLIDAVIAAIERGNDGVVTGVVTLEQ